MLRFLTSTVPLALLLTSGGVLPAQPHHGPMAGHHQDMTAIHELFDQHDKISRTVTRLPDGVVTVTESNDARLAPVLRQHVAAMYQRLAKGQPIREWDPLYAELFRQAGKIKMEFTNTEKGVRVKETSEDPFVVKLIQAHAEGVTEFVEKGHAVMHKEHPVPAAAAAPAWTALPLATAIGEGPDQDVKTLFDGARRRLVQITLRNGAVLARHQVAMPVTIQCVAGAGTLQAGDGGKLALKPGSLVTLEPGVPHSIQASPAVTILLTQFPEN